MTSDKNIGRWFGGLLLSAMVLGIWNNFGLTGPIFPAQGYLKTAAGMAPPLGSSVLLYRGQRVPRIIAALGVPAARADPAHRAVRARGRR